MHNAELDPGLRIGGVDRVGKALEAVNTGDKNILHQFRH
jgi:hypothetical protein